METLYNENINLIRSTAGKIARKYRVDYNDILSQANVIFCECANTHDNTIGCFAKYLLSSMWKKINWYIIKNYVREIPVDDMTIAMNSNLCYYDKNDMKLALEQSISALDEDTKKIIDLVIKDNLCFFNKKITKTAVKKELINRYSWTYRKIDYHFSQISTMLWENR